MLATLTLGIGFFALAVLGLSLGVIFHKKTPLKGSCHAPVDRIPGAEYACGSCSCHHEETKSPVPVQIQLR